MIQHVEIQNVTLKGDGVARLNGKVVFVPGALPGETVSIHPLVDKKSFMKAELVSIERPADDRTPPLCRHAAECGGCTFWHTSRAFEHKFGAAVETIGRIGGWRGDIRAVPAPRDDDWRERVTLHVEDGAVGFFKRGTHEVFSLEHCEVMHPTLREVVSQLDVSGRHSGSLFLELNGEESAHLTITGGLEANGRFPDTIGALSGQTVGRRKRDDRSINVTLQTEPPSSVAIPSGLFRQANREMNSYLVQFAARHVGTNDRVVEYFCGYGNLSFPIAERVESLHGYEADEVAIATARTIAAELDVTNATFSARDLFVAPPKLDDTTIALLDPPRAGAAAVCERIARSSVGRVVYISCDVGTFARDLKTLTESGFEVHECEILDMFPRTSHVEVVCYLER